MQEWKMQVLEGEGPFWDKLADYLSVKDFETLFKTDNMFKRVLMKHYRQRNSYFRDESGLHENFSFSPPIKPRQLNSVHFYPLEPPFSILLAAEKQLGNVSHFDIHVAVYRELDDLERSGSPVYAEKGEKHLYNQPQFSRVATGMFSFQSGQYMSRPYSLGREIVVVGNVVVAGRKAIKFHFGKGQICRMSPLYAIDYFPSEDRSVVPTLIRSVGDYVYAVSDNGWLSIQKIHGAKDNKIGIEDTVVAYKVLKMRAPNLRGLGSHAYFVSEVENHLGGWCVQNNRRLHFLRVDGGRDVSVIKMFTFEGDEDERNPTFLTHATYHFLDSFIPERNGFHTDALADQLSCLSGDGKQLYPEYKTTSSGMIVCALINRRHWGLMQVVVLNGNDRSLLSNVILDGDLGVGFSGYEMNRTELILEDGCLIWHALLMQSSHQFGNKYVAVYYRATDLTCKRANYPI